MTEKEFMAKWREKVDPRRHPDRSDSAGRLFWTLSYDFDAPHVPEMVADFLGIDDRPKNGMAYDRAAAYRAKHPVRLITEPATKDGLLQMIDEIEHDRFESEANDMFDEDLRELSND